MHNKVMLLQKYVLCSGAESCYILELDDFELDDFELDN